VLFRCLSEGQSCPFAIFLSKSEIAKMAYNVDVLT
jgi:hypothetical protein